MTTPEERAQSAAIFAYCSCHMASTPPHHDEYCLFTRIAVAIREAVEAEREACAALCDGTAGGHYMAKMCASAIRARGDK